MGFIPRTLLRLARPLFLIHLAGYWMVASTRSSLKSTSKHIGALSNLIYGRFLTWRSWGAAIVLAVNILVFPMTSEKELRRTLSLSLEHIATFSHLLSKVLSSSCWFWCRPLTLPKGYTLELTEEERIVRDQLAQNIRVREVIL